MKNTQRGFIPILILVTVLVIGGGVYYWQKTKVSSSENTGVQNEVEQNSFHVIETSPQPTAGVKTLNTGPMTVEQIEQQKIQENMAANQGVQKDNLVSKSCTNSIKAEESTSAEYATLVLQGWTFQKAVISDFDCDGSRDVIVASYYSDSSQQFFKGNLQFFQKVNGSWKLINQNDFLGESFEIHSAKTPEGGNAVALTSKSSSVKSIVWIRNGYLTGI